MSQEAGARGAMKRVKREEVGIPTPIAGLHHSKRDRPVVPALLRPTFVSSFLTPPQSFEFYDEDCWTEIAKHLCGRDLVRLSLSCRWFHGLLTEDTIWGYALLRDLWLLTGVANSFPPRPPNRSWRQIYAAAFNGSHAFSFRQQEKYIDGFRIGEIQFEKSSMLLTSMLAVPPWLSQADEGVQTSIEKRGACMLSNITQGIWIADMNLVRCTCSLQNCEATMQVLDLRHCELYLDNNFRDGIWEYEDLGHHLIEDEADFAGAAVFNVNHLSSQFAADVLNAKLWIRRRHNLQPKGYFTHVALAVGTNLRPNNGLLSRFQAMRDTTRDGQIVSVRVLQRPYNCCILKLLLDSLKGNTEYMCGTSLYTVLLPPFRINWRHFVLGTEEVLDCSYQ